MKPVQPPPHLGPPDRRGWSRFVELSTRRPLAVPRHASASSRRPAAAPASAFHPAAHALSHHDILSLLEPFVRRGRQVDLGASDRLHRRLVFKCQQHDAPAPDLPALGETLELLSPRPGRFRLVRVLADGHGLCARLQADGARPEDLLDRIDAVPIERQWHAEPGFVAAQSHRVDSAPGSPLLLTAAEVRLEVLTLKMDVPETPGVPARIELDSACTRSLPEDLLAVLGWSWSALQRGPGGFIGCLRLHGGRALRSSDAEGKLLATARHLARTLAEPPRAFHRRLYLARWGVALRRAIPLGVGGSLVTLAAAAEPLNLALHSPPAVLLVGAPLALLVMYFLRGAAPRIELPGLPRDDQPASW